MFPPWRTSLRLSKSDNEARRFSACNNSNSPQLWWCKMFMSDLKYFKVLKLQQNKKMFGIDVHLLHFNNLKKPVCEQAARSCHELTNIRRFFTIPETTSPQSKLRRDFLLKCRIHRTAESEDLFIVQTCSNFKLPDTVQASTNTRTWATWNSLPGCTCFCCLCRCSCWHASAAWRSAWRQATKLWVCYILGMVI